MRNKWGFTLIEVAVTVAIIGALASVTIVTFTNQQIKARDSARSSKATLIADALERYYQANGEYPSARAMLNTYGDNTGASVATRLSISEAGTLVMPKATGGTTNSIAAALSSDDVIAYVPRSTVGDTNCQTNAQGGCDEFTLSYKEEATSNTVTIESQNKGRVVADVPLQAPAKPTLSVVQTGTNVIATSATPTCSTTSSMTPRYSFRTQVGAGAWSAWSAWSATNTITQSGVNATGYSFQVHVRCESATIISDTSADSDTASITYYTPPATPATPSISISVPGSVVGTVSAVSCTAGSVQYIIGYRTNDGGWADTGWGSGTTASLGASEGAKYGFSATARCVNGTQTATSASSAEATYVHPISTVPNQPGTSGADSANKTWSWWPTTACPSGTWATYQYTFLVYGDRSPAAWNAIGWTDAWGGTSATNYSATIEGAHYNIAVIQRCNSNYTSGGWSALTAWGGTFTNSVNWRQVWGWSMLLLSDYHPYIRINTYNAFCASGTVLQTKITASWNNGAWGTYNDWFDAWAPQEVYINGTIPSSGNLVELWPRSRCINPYTGVVSGPTADGMSRYYNIGNLYNRGGGKYNISCGWGSAGLSLCSGGWNSSGTAYSTGYYDVCRVFSGGISDDNNRWTNKLSYGSAPRCWTNGG